MLRLLLTTNYFYNEHGDLARTTRSGDSPSALAPQQAALRSSSSMPTLSSHHICATRSTTPSSAADDRSHRASLAATGIDYLRLCSKALGKPALIGPLLDRYLIENVSYSFGTQAHMLPRAGASILIAALRKIVAPIDDSLDHARQRSLLRAHPRKPLLR
jgi:hypothetical protein